MPSPFSLFFHSSIGKKKKKKKLEKKNCISHRVSPNCFCHIKNNCPQVKNAPAELQPFQGEKEVFTNLTGFQAAKTPSKW